MDQDHSFPPTKESKVKKSVIFVILAALFLAACGSTKPVGKVPNDGFPANTYRGYPNESHDAT